MTKKTLQCGCHVLMKLYSRLLSYLLIKSACVRACVCVYIGGGQLDLPCNPSMVHPGISSMLAHRVLSLHLPGGG